MRTPADGWAQESMFLYFMLENDADLARKQLAEFTNEELRNVNDAMSRGLTIIREELDARHRITDGDRAQAQGSAGGGQP